MISGVTTGRKKKISHIKIVKEINVINKKIQILRTRTLIQLINMSVRE
jgi:hypothetical protein